MSNVTFISDAFPDAAGTDIGSRLPAIGGAWPTGQIKVGSNADSYFFNSGQNYCANATAPPNFDADVYATLYHIDDNNNAMIGIMWGTVEFRYRPSTAGLLFGYNGSDLSGGPTAAYTPVSGDVFHIQARKSGTSLIVTGFINGVQKITATIASYNFGLSYSAQIGMMDYCAVAPTASTGNHWKSFLATYPVTASLSPSPNSLAAGSGAQAVTLTGTGTNFAVGTSSQFTLSGVGTTGASLSSPNATSTTAATVSINPGSTAGTLTITDTGSGATTTISVYVLVAPGTPVVTFKPTAGGDIITIPAAVAAGTNAVASYKLYKGTTPGGESATAVATITPGSFPASFAAQTRPTAGQNFYYTVKAVDSGGNLSAASNEVKSATSGITASGTTYAHTSIAPYGVSGLAATLGLTVYDANGAVLVPYTVGGLSEIGGIGAYITQLTLDSAWSGVIVCDAPSGGSPYVETFDVPSSVSLSGGQITSLASQVAAAIKVPGRLL